MKRIWIVAANHQCARVFAASDRHALELEELNDLIEPSARLLVQELESDAPARSPSGTDTGPRSGEPKRNAKKQEAIRFAKRIAESLKQARLQARISRLYLVAEPTMMGLMRDALDDSTRELVADEISSNVVTLSAAEIREHLPKVL